MRTPKLKRINLKKRYSKKGFVNEANPGNQHPDIRHGVSYLVKIHGSLYTGSFGKQWYGWCFNGWHAPMQLGTTSITDVWQIVK